MRNPVITIRHFVVLGSVFCISIAGTLAQDNENQEALRAMLVQGNPDSDAIAKHRLTVENVRQMFAVDRELFPLMKEPDLERRTDELAERIDPQRRLGVVAVGAKVYEATPEIAEILRRHGISGREYMLTHLVAMVTAMTDDSFTDEVLRHEGLSEIPPVLMTQALKFWRSMAPALKVEAAEWKKMHGYDKGINR
jgi:hypothetical protein